MIPPATIISWPATPTAKELLQNWSYVYDWEQENEVRLMASFETTPEDVDKMLEGIRWAMKESIENES